MMLAIAGLFLGLLSATIIESVGHKLFGHPGRLQLRLYFRFPKLFDPFLRAHYHHFVIHHTKTYQTGMFDQFTSEANKREVDEWIARTFPADFAGLVWRERYNLTLRGRQGILPFAIPFLSGPLLIYFALGPVTSACSLFTAFIPVWMSKYIHPLVHCPEDATHGGRVVKAIMRTRYMRRILVNHFMHHRHLETNFNLLLGGDVLVGLHRHPTGVEKRELVQLLKEFDRRRSVARGISKVAQVLFLLSALHAAMPLPAHAAELSLEDVSREEAAYLNLEHPNIDQRFVYQRWKSKVFRAAEAQGWADILKTRDEGRIDYGFDPDDYHISFFDWEKRKEFAMESYEANGDFVKFRGVTLEPGDMFLTNLSSDSDGIFTTLTEHRNSFSHVAVYVVLQDQGRKFPAVIEIHDEGVRAVPLRFFLSDRMSTYVEIYRFRSVPASAWSAMGDAALQLIQETHGFDFFMVESQKRYLTCALTASELLRRAGLVPIPGESYYSVKSGPNLHVLGVESGLGRKLLMPDDFTRDSRLHLVAVVDNDRFDRVTSRALTRDRIQDYWQSRVLEEENFPFDYRIYHFAVRSIQTHSWIAPVFLKFLGFREDNFPSGPAPFLSLAKPALERNEEATRQVAKWLPPHWEKLFRYATWRETEEDPDIRAQVDEALAGFAGMYRVREK